jgi:hypothetical protein
LWMYTPPGNSLRRVGALGMRSPWKTVQRKWRYFIGHVVHNKCHYFCVCFPSSWKSSLIPLPFATMLGLRVFLRIFSCLRGSRYQSGKVHFWWWGGPYLTSFALIVWWYAWQTSFSLLNFLATDTYDRKSESSSSSEPWTLVRNIPGQRP